MSKCSIWYFDNFMVSRDRFLREDSIWLYSLAHRMRFGILSWQQRNVKRDRLDFIKRSQARVISIYLENNAPSVVKMILNLFLSSDLEYKVKIYALDHHKCFFYWRSTGTFPTGLPDGRFKIVKQRESKELIGTGNRVSALSGRSDGFSNMVWALGFPTDQTWQERFRRSLVCIMMLT